MKEQHKRILDPKTVAALCVYLSVAVLCFANRDKITIASIVSYTPDDPVLAAAVMIALFTLKGCTVLLNGNVLYAASGVLFSLPVAMAVNSIGTVLMTTIPFFIGRKSGADMMESLVKKYKKLELVRNAPRHNEFVFTLFIRVLGILPCEPMGMYLGACGLRYRNFILGTMLGLAPAIAAYAIIGEYAAIPTSPQFVIAAVFQLSTTLCSLLAAFVWRKRNKKQEGMKPCKK